MQYWLVKSEPSVCSIESVKKIGWTMWEGVRNYQARNHLKSMKVDDLVLFYHSVEAPIGVAGIVKVIKEAYPDPTQFDQKSEYFDSKSSKDSPRWFCPNMGFVKKFAKIITLYELREQEELKSMSLLQKGSRLSVHKLTKYEYDIIDKLGE